MITARSLLFGFCALIATYVGWRFYVKYFYTTPPTIEVTGITENNYYSGNIACQICVHSRGKLSTVKLFLDNDAILTKTVPHGSKYDEEFTLATRSLTTGLHTLKIEATDATRNHNQATFIVPFGADNLPLQVCFARPESDFKVSQGRTFHLIIATNKPLKRVVLNLFSREFVAVPESDNARIYEAFVPLECEEKTGDYPFTVLIEDHVGNYTTLASKLTVVPAQFKRQILHHIDSEKFAEERKLGISDKEFKDQLLEISTKSPKKKLWRGVFYVPLNSNWITCEFGTKRVSQERGCYTHAAVDMVGPAPRSIVWAPQDGIVAIKDRFEVNGNTVVIDHGCGVVSILCHLDQFADIAVGDKIRRGSPLGYTGKTGYATGDHLHWEMRVNNVNVDPLQWTKADF